MAIIIALKYLNKQKKYREIILAKKGQTLS